MVFCKVKSVNLKLFKIFFTFNKVTSDFISKKFNLTFYISGVTAL